MKDVSIIEQGLEELFNLKDNAQSTQDLFPVLQQIDKLKQALAAYHSSDKGEDEGEYNPYWYWPQCDVEGCEGVSCNGGGCWRETGYWQVCPEHSKMFREGKPQPKMKQSSIDKEATRDKVTGYLPSPQNTNP